MTSRHELLGQLHSLVKPRGYLEIGVSFGKSLTLSRAPSVAVDPVSRLSEEIHSDLQFVNDTSDSFFSHPDPLRHLPNRVLDLSFIDGMHLVEFVLRDFINVERHSHPGTVVVLDDVLPRNNAEAAREPRSGDWTGDVYKISAILEQHRPDLVCLPVDTSPTGTMIVLGLDRHNRSLNRAYESIIAEHMTPDPQDVPEHIIERRAALTPARALEPAFWDWLVQHREGLHTRQWGPGVVARRARALLTDAPSARPLAVDNALVAAGEARHLLRPRTRLRQRQRR